MEMRSFVVATLLCVGFFATAAASAELPLMPPLERVRVPHSTAAEAPGLIGRLIRLYFGDQVRWRPFSDWPEESASGSHHRVVREYRPRRTNVESLKLPEVVGLYLRGNPLAPNPHG